MTGLDIFSAAVAVALVAHGIIKGGVRNLFGLAGLVVAYLYAGYASLPLARLLTFLPEAVRHTVAVVAGFALIFTVVAVVGMLLNRAVEESGLSPWNRALGGLLGLVLACYLAGGAVRVAPRLGPSFREKVERSWVTRSLAAGALFVEQLLPTPLNAPPPPPADSPAERPPG